MTYNEETYVLHILKKIRDETHENNILLKENNKTLKQLIEIAKVELLNARKKDEDDFGRNVLANMFSNQLEFINNNHKYKRYGIH